MISVPLVLAINIISLVLQIFIEARIESNPSLAIIAIVLYVLITLIGGAFIVPFWQTIKAVIYYDLQARREATGIDLGK